MEREPEREESCKGISWEKHHREHNRLYSGVIKLECFQEFIKVYPLNAPNFEWYCYLDCCYNSTCNICRAFILGI